MDDVTIARALHVLAVVHWIGGVAMVTAVILPALRRRGEAAERLALFEAVEGRFGGQAKVSTLLAGASGFYMTWRMDAWDRFLDPGLWWMHAMVAVWAIFTVVLFAAEPLILHRWFRDRAALDPEGTFALVQRFHWVLLAASLIAVAGAVLGAHGMLY
ncbi:hypothetical protein [Shumkonia mesophila]|uniref:hypothetical protein n=1 Tax=Shumkonia mesophila TaxID=2838854 RepID=UPI0029343922|nr:hypothetical protein [Shumkonia mesophila]